jgi:hypothetical protein
MTLTHSIGQSLDSIGLRAPFLKMRRFLTEPAYRESTQALERDLRETREQLAGFMKDGAERADPARQVLIVSQSNLPFYIKFHGLLAKAIQLKGLTPVIVTYSHNKLAPKYLEAMGIPDILYWDHFAKEFSPDPVEVEKVVEDFLSDNPGVQAIKQWKFRGVFAAKQALSRAIRKALHGQFSLTDPEQRRLFKEQLRTSVGAVFLAEQLLKSRNVVKVLARDAGYTPNGAIYETALNHGIDSVRVEIGLMRGCWLLKRYTPETLGKETLWSMAGPAWDAIKNIPLTPAQEKATEVNFQERYNPSSLTDICKYQLGKQEISLQDVQRELGLDPAKKTAAIFSHITWDASFFDGDDLYDDYEHWLVETVRVACKNPSLNWIVKLHPANVFKLKRENGGIEKEESELIALKRLGPLPNHVKILRANTGINTLSLYSAIDYGITVRGTVGMELPWLRKPVVVAGTGRYSGFGFVVDCPTRESYETQLLNLHRLPAVSDEQAALARRYYYWMFLRRHVSFEDIAPMHSMIMEKPTHPLHFNVSVKARSLADVENSPSVKAFTDWLMSSREADFIV